MDIGSGVNHGKRDTFTVADDMPFRAIFLAICGIRASLGPPKRARTELLSTTSLFQSILFANPNSSKSFFQIFCRIPATCQSRSLRQHVMSLPHHGSRGKSPKQFLSEPQTESPLMPDDPEPLADHLSDGAVRAAKSADSFSKVLLLSVAWHLRSSLNGATQYTLQL
jgi:hypothetical protein